MSPFTGRKKWKACNKTREKYMPVKRRQNLAETGWGSYYKEAWLEPQPIQASLRRLQDVLKRSRCLTTKQDVVTTSGKMLDWWRLIYVVLKTPNLRRHEDVWFTMSSGSLVYDVLKTYDLHRLEDDQFGTSWTRLIYDAFRTSNYDVLLWRQII